MKFASNKNSDETVNASKVTVLSLGFELKGDVISKNDIRADGILRGNIRTDKKVVVGEEASIFGDIMADEISISGEVIGDLYINGETTIYPSAKVSGKILTHQIFIHKGAYLDSCIRTASQESIKKEKEKEQAQYNPVDMEKAFPIIESNTEKKEPIIEEVNMVTEDFYSEKAEETVPPLTKSLHRSW